MPSSTTIDPPAEAVAVAQQYYRHSRPLTGLVALTTAGVVGVGYLLLSFWQWLLVSAVLLAIVRVPLYTTGGEYRLATAKPPETVRDEFESPTPPVLALQWGLADSIEATDDGGRFEISYLFGVRSVTVTTACRPTPNAPDSDFELVVTEGDDPWGRYQCTIDTAHSNEIDAETRIDIDVQAGRRFGLRRLPQWMVATRYRDAGLEAQGYTVVDRDGNLSLL
jgi:hypothetical protein